MSDELSPLPAEQPEEDAGYPRGRYVSLLVVLALLMILIGAARFILPSHAGKQSTERETMQADLSMKAYFVTEYSTSINPPNSSIEPRLFPANRGKKKQDLRQEAIKYYLRAVEKDPSARNIRRLIIVETAANRGMAIRRFDNVSRADTESGSKRIDYSAEVSMWRAIYESHDKLSTSDVAKYESRINKLDLRWYRKLALADLYDRAGMKDKASGERRSAATDAALAVIPLGLMMMGLMCVILIGVVLDVYYLAKKRSGWPGAPSDLVSLPQAERSRVSGLLLEVFVVYILVFIGSQIVFGMFAGLAAKAGLLHANSTSLVILELFMYVGWGLISLLYLVYRLRGTGRSLADLGLKSHDLWRDIRWGIAGYMAGFPVVLAAGLISQKLTGSFKTPPNPVESLTVMNDSWLARLVLFLLLAVAAPFFEELFFRGVLLNSLRARWALAVAILASGVVFAAVHPLPLGFLPILTLGSVFSVLFYQRGSLIPNMIAHCLHNSMIFVLMTLISS
ncbi:MAG TPA: type II CAAX endopeptidase family protein [Armatimonadota bacterium]|jgi:hypothetical protein